MRRPWIGITPGFRSDKDRIQINKGYTDAVIKAGGMPVLLPLTGEEELLSEILESCDGLLLSGGPDVDARYFGEVNYSFTGPINPYRDAQELYLAKRAVELDKPVLGICRGVQVLNIALGGTIYQDIHSQAKGDFQEKAGALIRHSQDAPGWYPIHEVILEEGSKLQQCFGVPRLGVNSYHHQAVRDLGEGLVATSHSPDGIIESVEHKYCRFVMGVQWHPELMWRENPESLKLFEMLVKTA